MNTKRPTHRILMLALAGAITAGAAEKGILDKLLGKESAIIMTSEELDTALSVEDFIGRKVVNQDGIYLGKITDLTLRDRNGGFDQAVLEVGSLLDWNKSLIAVPYDQMEHRAGTPHMVWEISRKDFQALVDQSKVQRNRGATSKHRSPQHELSGSAKEARSNLSSSRRTNLDATNASDALVQKVMKAIREDEKLATRDRDIKILHQDDRLIVQGEVESAEVKNHILLLVKRITNQKVVDEMVIN